MDGLITRRTGKYYSKNERSVSGQANPVAAVGRVADITRWRWHSFMAKTSLRQAFGAAAKAAHNEWTDRDLLRQFADDRDQEAFAVLVRRHTHLVLGVGRRAGLCGADADDVCQAVFLVLAKKAKGTRWQASVANWIYTTARRVVQNVCKRSARRNKREAIAAKPECTPPADEMTARELFAALDDELHRLSTLYREPLILSYLEGLSREETAARLGVPAGTVKSRLERGRQQLSAALARRGVTAGLALLTLAVLPASACPAQLFDSILVAVGGTPSRAVLAIAKGVSMNTGLAKLLLGVTATVGLIVVGFMIGKPGSTAAADDKPAARTDAAKETSDQIRIRVVDPDGKSVAGATVYRHGYSHLKSPPTETVVGKTDEDGKLVVEWKPFITFHATADGYCAGASGYLEGANAVTIRLAKPHAIKGRLVDLQGKPVPDAKVIVESISASTNDDLTAAYDAYRVNPEWTWQALPIQLDGNATGAPKGVTTDADGRFTLTDVGRMRLVHLRFEGNGIEAARAVVFADPDFDKRKKSPTDAEKKMSGMSGDYRAATHGPEFTHATRPDHVITGTVTDAITGKPIAGVKVVGTASKVMQTFSGNAWHDKVEATTDQNGKYRLGGLVKAKTRYLHVQGSDTAPYLDRLAEVPDSAGYTPLTADVKLQPAVLVRGKLVNQVSGKGVRGEAFWMPLNGNPQEKLLIGGEIYFGHVDGTRSSGTHADTAADGTFTLRVPRGPGVILARADQFDPTAVFTPTRVRDEDRKYLRKNEKGPDTIETGPRDRDDEEYFNTGSFLTPIRWENGYAVINPDSKAKSIEPIVTFDPGATVKLNVTDPDGNPLSGVKVVGPGSYGLRPPTFNQPEIAVGGIDPKGRPVQLYLLHKGRKLCAELIVKGDEKGPVAVKLKPCGSVTGRVVDHTGKSASGARVSFQMADYVADDLLRQKLYRRGTEVETDADGKFTFSGLFPDLEFDLFVGLPGFRSGAAEAKRTKLKPGETTDVGEFKMRDPKKIDEE